MREIAIDARSPWCKSQNERIYSVLVRLKNRRHASSMTRLRLVSHQEQRSPRSRQGSMSALAFAAMAVPAAYGEGKTITAVMHSDLRIIDPLFTTAYITRDHGYMVYDTLLATNANFKIQPQMADWKVSDDKLTYAFTLRDGLKWHDGTPVTAEDCVAHS